MTTTKATIMAFLAYGAVYLVIELIEAIFGVVI